MMKNLKFLIVVAGAALFTYSLESNIVHQLPAGFVFLTDIDPTIIESSRYYSDDNFTGHRVEGYAQPRIICTKQAAQQLKQAHEIFKKRGYNIVVYDAYRPQSAVDSFMKWSQNVRDQKMKTLYYPTIDKKDLFKLEYIHSHSGHSCGNRFDLTLIEIGKSLTPIMCSERIITNGESILFLDDNTVDMGSAFDLFHEASHHDTVLIEDSYTKKRNFLRSIMIQYGFEPYALEWWHYSLKEEPCPMKYFEFVYIDTLTNTL